MSTTSFIGRGDHDKNAFSISDGDSARICGDWKWLGSNVDAQNRAGTSTPNFSPEHCDACGQHALNRAADGGSRGAIEYGFGGEGRTNYRPQGSY